jgi:hypothetical protein
MVLTRMRETIETVFVHHSGGQSSDSLYYVTLNLLVEIDRGFHRLNF